MARPGIIIGLGGTGQSVLTFLKKDLLEIYRGRLPDNVKLLSFDTMPEAGIEEIRVISPDDVKKDRSVGGVRLETDKEFVALRDNGFKYGEQVAKGQVPHVGSWFDAKFYRDAAMPALWDLANGAGQVRQFGRLGFFMKVDSEIWRLIRQAYVDVKQVVKTNYELEVIIVASFAGGTGAGMFIDTAIVCRALSELVDNNLLIRGFFVLPRVFGGSGQLGERQDHMQARSFAAWRELDRFMSMGSDFGTRRIIYRPGDDNLDITLEARPFDVVYLVDSRRDTYSLEGVDPEEGIFPSIADFISAILDESSGRKYTQDINTNVAGIQVQSQSRSPRYSVFGTYTLKVPIYYALQERALSFAHDLLDMWLVPVADQAGRVTKLSEIANQEVGEGASGREGTASFILSNGVEVRVGANQKEFADSEESRATHLIENTHFLHRVADVFQHRAIDDGISIQRDAEGGHALLYQGQVDPSSYIGILTTLPTDAGDEKLLADINTELAASVWLDAPPSREFGDTPPDALYRFDRDIPKFRRDHFGTGDVGGLTVRGRYGDMLDNARRFQIKRFRELLHQWSLNVLNGVTSDIYSARRGKLGYALAFYSGLVEAFDYFIRYMDKVRERRADLQLKNSCNQVEDTTRSAMRSAAFKKFLFYFTHPRAHKTQLQYLQAIDESNMVTQDDMLLSALRQTAEGIRSIAEDASVQALRWVELLATGNEALGIVGLREQLESLNNSIEATHKADHSANRTQMLLELGKYVKDEDQLKKELSRFSWDISASDGFQINCKVLIPEATSEGGETVITDVEKEFEKNPAIAKEHNLYLITNLGQAQYRRIPDEHPVLKEIMEGKKYISPEEFVRDALDRCEPLIDIRAGASQTGYIKSLYIRMKHKELSPAITQYAQSVLERLQELRPVDPQNIQITESGDGHKCTFIRSIDNISSEDFALWDSLYSAYLRHIQGGGARENAARLHIFPAECNAAEYERKLFSLLNKRHRILHPRVVMLLEDKEKASLFFRCDAYKFIKDNETDAGEKTYALDLSRGEEKRKDKVILTNPKNSEGKIRQDWPDVFERMNAFVLVGRDVINPQRYIVWDRVREEVLREERALKVKGELEERLMKAINEGLVAQMRSEGEARIEAEREMRPDISRDRVGWFWHPGQDYLDLADVAEMMYREVLAEQTRTV